MDPFEVKKKILVIRDVVAKINLAEVRKLLYDCSLLTQYKWLKYPKNEKRLQVKSLLIYLIIIILFQSSSFEYPNSAQFNG